MYPLIEIKTVPIEIQMKTKNASLEYTRGTAEMEISRSDNGELDIKSRPIKLQMDTFEARAVNQNVARITSQGAYQATASFAETGQLTVDAKLAQTPVAQGLPTIPAQAATAQVAAAQASTGMELEDAAMQIRYEMDKMNFDWKVDQGEFKFTPGDIEITVEQQPSVTIKYTGGPIYVPRSADPNYQAVDVKA